MRTITFGYRKEGLALHKWAYKNTDLQAIVLPDNRMEEPTTPKIREWADAKNVTMLVQTKLDFAKFVRMFKPDLILCHCYTYKLTEDILKIPRLGCINIHPGKLPDYAGRSPIEVALKNGDKKLWVTLHYMDEGFDTGKKISECSVDRVDDLMVLRKQLTTAGLNLLSYYIRTLA